MSSVSSQLGLFEPDRTTDRGQEAQARTRMHAMIGRLKAASAPPWRDQMGAILDDGAFKRAMRLVPAEEAQTLWAEFDAQMERLYSIWLRSDPPEAHQP